MLSPFPLLLLLSFQAPNDRTTVDQSVKARDASVCITTERGDLQVVRGMMDGKPALSPELLERCLVAAAGTGNVALLEYWLDRGAQPIPKWETGSTKKVNDASASDEELGSRYRKVAVLQAGIDSGNPAMVQRLLQFPFDLRSDAFGLFEPVLVYTVGDGASRDEAKHISMANRVAIVKLLIAHGADPKAADVMGHTALFEVSGKSDLVPVLVAAGADVNARDDSRRTPLMYNADDTGAVRALLAAGADPKLTDDEGNTAQNEAKVAGCDKCVALIKSAAAIR